MVEYQKMGASGVAKAALATGITGAAFGLLGGGGGIPFLRGGAGVPVAPFAADPTGGYVTDKDMTLIREISEKDSIIARQGAELYTNSHITASLGPVYAELGKQKDDICDLKAALSMEVERRGSGDRELLTYVDGNYIKARKRLSGADIDYDGCEPVIRPKRCCCCNSGTGDDAGG